MEGPHTCVSRLGDDLTEELCEVGQVISQERGLHHKSLSRVVCPQLTSQKLGLPRDPQSGSFIGVLRPGNKLAHRPPSSPGGTAQCT